jgi:hypothetical protein
LPQSCLNGRPVRHRSSSSWVGSNQFKQWDILEDGVMGYERKAKPDRGRRDPSVAVVDLVAKSVSGPLTVSSQLGAHGNHLVVGLDNR